MENTNTITTTKQKRVFSGLKPTGQLTIGNYIGAIKNMIELQKDNDCFYSVVDMHSITIDIEPAILRKNSLDMLALFLACGINPDKSTVFIQSHVKEHAELTWILNCHTMMGEARRMIQFREKSKENKQNVNVGLFDYPVLMAADILLYQADLVPIGKDQKQHLELARNLATRFNNKYSPTFTVPDGVFNKTGAKVFSLLEPKSKMGKTGDNPNGIVFLLDNKDDIMRKFKKCVTDSETEIKAKTTKPGISNLLTIYSQFKNVTIKEAEKEFAGFSYADFKLSAGECVADFLGKIQKEYKRIINDKAYLESIMKTGAEKARLSAYRTLDKVKKKIGFIV
ncbi:MAG: tryptophan--tRNA ligase [Firmicutes bacterium]|nr:tryptophan--tRNA ligase [Bacillota bacterium]